MDLGKALGQEGRQGVGVGIPDQQELAAVSGVLIPDDAQGLVAAQEGGVFVLLGQIAPVVQYAGFRRAGAPGGDHEAVLFDPEFHGVRRQPVDAGLGVQRAIEAGTGNLWCKAFLL